jgi:hypothetical protein
MMGVRAGRHHVKQMALLYVPPTWGLMGRRSPVDYVGSPHLMRKTQDCIQSSIHPSIHPSIWTHLLSSYFIHPNKH